MFISGSTAIILNEDEKAEIAQSVTDAVTTQLESDISDIRGAAETLVTFEDELNGLKKNDADFQDKLDKLTDVIAGEHSDSWNAVQKIVQIGKGADIFPVGTQFVTSHSEFGEMIWDVVDHQNVISESGETIPGMQLLMHNVSEKLFKFDEREALYYCEEPVLAGTYYFTIPSSYNSAKNDLKTADDVQTTPIQFTLTKNVEKGGVIVLSWGNVQLSLSTIKTYSSPYNLTEQESVKIQRGTSGTFLGDASSKITGNMNSLNRCTNGSGNYKESAIRQYLNSAGQAGEYWEPQTKFDMIPSFAVSNNGFMAGLDSEFLNAVCPVRITTCTNNISEVSDDINSSYITVDKFYLPSLMEITGTSQNNIKEGMFLAFYKGASNLDYVKYDKSGVPRDWWYRSPVYYELNRVYLCNSNGSSASSYYANTEYRIAVMCTIA